MMLFEAGKILILKEASEFFKVLAEMNMPKDIARNEERWRHLSSYIFSPRFRALQEIPTMSCKVENVKKNQSIKVFVTFKMCVFINSLQN